MSLYSYVLSPRCPLLFILFYCLKKYKMSPSILPKMMMSSFSFRTSSGEMSSFVSLILRGRSGECCHNLSRCRDRLKYNSHFLGSSFLSPRPIPSSNDLTGISCSLNCYPVEMTISSPHYLPLLFEFLDHDRCSCSVFLLDSLSLFRSVYFRFFLMVFLF